MSTDRYIRDAALRFLRQTAGKETARRAAAAGKYGPAFRQPGAKRGKLRLLDTVLAALKIAETDLDRLLAAYEAGRRVDRAPILELHPSEVVEVA